MIIQLFFQMLKILNLNHQDDKKVPRKVRFEIGVSLKYWAKLEIKDTCKCVNGTKIILYLAYFL